MLPTCHAIFAVGTLLTSEAVFYKATITRFPAPDFIISLAVTTGKTHYCGYKLEQSPHQDHRGEAVINCMRNALRQLSAGSRHFRADLAPVRQHRFGCGPAALRLHLVSLLILPVVAAAADRPAGKSEPVISTCDKPFMFGFGSWEKAKEVFPAKADGIHLGAKSAQGGAGIAGLNVNLTGYGDWSPAMTLAVTAAEPGREP